MSAARVALATCSLFPELYEDERPLLGALAALGVTAEPAVWDDLSVEWGRYELVVIRSVWDYFPRRAEFLAWADSVPRLLNSADVVRWNTDKRYLGEVPGAIATTFVSNGGAWEPPARSYVVKPTVSGGAQETARYGPGDDGEPRVVELELTEPSLYLSVVSGAAERLAGKVVALLHD